jgi:hypothetical protein
VLRAARYAVINLEEVLELPACPIPVISFSTTLLVPHHWQAEFLIHLLF